MLPKGLFVHEMAIVESDQVGECTRVWAFAHIMAGAVVGKHCNICEQTFIESGARLGNNVTVKNGVSVWDRVVVEDDVFLGPNVVLTNDRNPRAAIKKTSKALLPTTIKRGATLGANATILCGITIGEDAFVAAGAVVTRDVANYEIKGGNPARHMGWMCSCGTRIPLGDSDTREEIATCPGCGIAYTRRLNVVERFTSE